MTTGSNSVRWIAMLVFALMAIVLEATANPVKLGWNERGGVFVDSGASAIQESDIILEQNAKFYKSGAGRLDLPPSKVNSQKPYSLTVLGGTLGLDAGEDATVDVSTPPVACRKAAFWVNADSTVVTGANLVAKWCDVRETDTTSPKMWYAEPRWNSNATTYMNVPPLLSEFDGRAGVYFYGRASNVYMQFVTNGTDTVMSNIRHAFIVHGIKDCWGAALGCSGSRTGGMVLDTDAFVRSLADCRFFFFPRFDLTKDYSGGRFFLNGNSFDPFATKPTAGGQMLEVDFLDLPSRASWFFRCGFETYTGNQGGDYLSEVIIFTTPLSEAERLDVGRYLLKKWNLKWDVPRLVNANLRPLRPTGVVNVVTNASVVVTAAEGTATDPLTFSGEGIVTKTGGGTLTMGPSSGAPFRGAFALDGGAVLSCGGRPLPLAAKSGSVYDSTAYKHAGEATASENYAKSGFLLTRTSGAGTGKVRKTGAGEVRFSSVEPDVEVLDVRAGVVTLESRPGGEPEHTANYTNVVVDVPNSSFEEPVDISSSSDGRVLFSGTKNGWSYVWLDGTHTYPAYSGLAKGWNNWSSMPPPDGNQALTLSMRSGARTTVQIPKAGRYRLSFKAIARYDYRKSPSKENRVHQIDVYFYKLNATAVKIGSVLPNATVFAQFVHPLEVSEAGDYVLRFIANDRISDETTTIDDVHIVYDAERDDVAFKVPNGDFEQLAPRTSSPYRYGYYTSLDAAKGWSFALDDPSGRTDLYIGITSPLKYLHSASSVSLWRFGSVDLGGNMLALMAKGGSATTQAFTAPRGTFRLQAKVAWTPTWYLEEYICTSAPQIRARLLRDGGGEIDLGILKPTSTLLATKTWPNEFTFSEPESVSLELSLDNAAGGGVVDDLVFVVPTADGGELLADGGFENVTSASSPWMRSRDNSHYQHANATYITDESPGAYGYTLFDGRVKAGIKNTALYAQDITFSTNGLYRLTVHASTRIDDATTARNPLRFWLTKEGSGVTNVIDTMAMPQTWNWYEREYLFSVPSSGTYRFGIQGGCGLEEIDPSTTADRMSFVDGLSIRRVVDEPAAAPIVPEGLKINVAKGARVVLNYPGRIKVRRAVLNGVSTGCGVFSAKTHPDFFGGMGEIEVDSPRCVIIVW